MKQRYQKIVFSHLNIELSFYELCVFMDDIFNVFYSSTKRTVSANVLATK